MTPAIRILSCNLYSGRTDPEAVADVIDSHFVDIVCAQELCRDTAATIAGILPHGDLTHEQVRGGNGIAARRPVRLRRLPLPLRDGWVASVAAADWPGIERDFDIVNVHVSAPHTWPYWPNPVRRGEQLERILAFRRETPAPHVLVGDFNASPAWPVYKSVSRHYEDAAEAINRGEPEYPGTWPNWPNLGINGLLRIDHCFLHRVQIRRFRQVAIRGADHFGLLLDVSPGDPAS